VLQETTAVKKLLLILIGTGLTLTVAATAWHFWHKHESEHIAYTLASIERATLEDVVSATGLVRPREVYVVGSDLSGRVVAVLADYNQTVNEGDVLLRLDDRLAKARLRQAETTVQLAQTAVKQAEIERGTTDKMYQRLLNMADEVRKPEDVDIAEGKLRAAEVVVEEACLKARQAEDARRQAEIGLRLTTLRAPVLQSAGSSASEERRPGTGVVSEDTEPPRGKRSFIVLERKVSVNQEIGSSVQGHLFTLASDLRRMRLTAEVGEGDIDKVRRGMAARFTVGGGGDNAPKYTGIVEEIHLTPSHEHGAVFFEVLIDARNERSRESDDWKLRPGQTASVDIIRRSHRDAWKVPSAALNFEPAADQHSAAVDQKLAQRVSLPNAEQWQTAWTTDPKGKPWPIFVRTGGTNEEDETGIEEDRFTEVLEWDSAVKDPAALKVITAAPPPRKSIFTIPNIKF
jgi:HlyD family secretion protein